MLDAAVVNNKRDAIDRAFATLAKVGPLDAPRLEQDALTAAAVERVLCRMVDLAVGTNLKVDYGIVAAAVPMALETYSAYRKQMASFVLDRTRPSGR